MTLTTSYLRTNATVVLYRFPHIWGNFREIRPIGDESGLSIVETASLSLDHK